MGKFSGVADKGEVVLLSKDVVGKFAGVFPKEAEGLVVDVTLIDFVVEERTVENVLGKFTGMVSTVYRPAAGELETKGEVLERG